MSNHEGGGTPDDDAFYDDLAANLPRPSQSCRQSSRCEAVGCFACGQLVNQGKQGGSKPGQPLSAGSGRVWEPEAWDGYADRMRKSARNPNRPCQLPGRVDEHIQIITDHKAAHGDFQDVPPEEDE